VPSPAIAKTHSRTHQSPSSSSSHAPIRLVDIAPRAARIAVVVIFVVVRAAFGARIIAVAVVDIVRRGLTSRATEHASADVI